MNRARLKHEIRLPPPPPLPRVAPLPSCQVSHRKTEPNLVLRSTSTRSSFLIWSCFYLGDRGLTGLKGTRGVAGIPGENGEPGIPGRVGIKGDKGEAGETTCYVTEKGRRLEKPCLEASVYDDSAGAQNTGDTGGLTYIRWGRTACPVGDAKIIYSGKILLYSGSLEPIKRGKIISSSQLANNAQSCFRSIKILRTRLTVFF